MRTSLYIHIPFCERKCIYCDFYSIEGISSMQSFLDAMECEIRMYAGFNTTDYSTVFFGGGTPSLLSPEQVDRILSLLAQTFFILPGAEVTLETNPGTVDLEKLRGFRNAGINRLSIGIQSFHEDELRFLGRIHDAHQGEEAVRLARAAGFANINIDLMYSLPGQTKERWASTLERAVALEPEHLSAYGLIIEDNTPLAKLVRSRQVSPNPPDAEAELYELTMATMEKHGYEHYEVSNYARRGFRSMHNSNYWHHGNYLGFGPSAHSFWREAEDRAGIRWWNVANLSAYVRALHRGEQPVAGREELSTEALMTERIFLGLRSDGVDLREFRREFGDELLKVRGGLIRELVQGNLAELANESLRLTSKGYLLCDEVCVRLVA
jgi:oxygen-independent coproporphyrinogen-3 oxidase